MRGGKRLLGDETEKYEIQDLHMGETKRRKQQTHGGWKNEDQTFECIYDALWMLLRGRISNCRRN